MILSHIGIYNISFPYNLVFIKLSNLYLYKTKIMVLRTNLKDFFNDSSYNINRTINSNTIPIKQPSNTTSETVDKYISSKIDFVQGGNYYLDHALKDTKRVTEYLTSGEGILWSLKQEGLHLMNPKRGYVTGIDPIQIFNPIKFLMNVPQGGFHIDRYGFTINDEIRYEKFYSLLNTTETYKTGNRLLRLYDEFGLNNSEVINDNKGPFDTITKYLTDNIQNEKVKNVIKNINDKLNGNINKEFSQIGGPNSFYGIGSTLIHKSTSGLTPIENNIYNVDNTYSDKYDEYNNLTKLYTNVFVDKNNRPGFKESPQYELDSNTMNTYQDIVNLQTNYSPYSKQYVNFEKPEILQEKVDYFKDIPGYQEKYNYDKNVSYFQNWNMAKRLGIADFSPLPENSGLGSSLKNEIQPRGTDAINMGSNNSEDLIKTRIGSIQFRSFVTGITDTYSPSWTPTKYIGRPDEVHVYEGTSRAISFTLLVPLFSAKEMDSVYYKLNKLVQYQSPIISETGQMTGQIINLKLGMWFSKTASTGLPVIMDSLSFTIDDEYPWDVIHEVPMIVSISLGFKVIDEYSPSSTKIYFRGTSK